jgi:hypothetical protein
MGRVSRTLFKLLLLLLVVASLLFITPLHEGKPLLSWSQVAWPTLPTPTLPAAPIQAEPTAPVTVYRWRDQHGVWQYGSTPPPDGSPYESRTVETTANAALFPPAAPRTADKAATTAPAPDPAPAAAPSPYSLDAVKQLFDDARKLRDQGNARQQAADDL